MKKTLIALGLIIALSGCCTQVPATTPIPASFLAPCDDLVALKGMDGAAVLQNITDNAAIYYSCKDSKQALVDAVKATQKK